MTAIPCPFCNAPIPLDSSVCVRCGKSGGERLEALNKLIVEENKRMVLLQQAEMLEDAERTRLETIRIAKKEPKSEH